MREHESKYRESCRQLTKKEQAFVREYLIDQNAAKAARKAGYSVACARQIGHENLSKPDIAIAVQAGLDAIAARCEVSAERVIHQIAAVAFASSYHFAEAEDGLLAVADGAAPESGVALQIRHRRIKKDDGSFATETLYIQHDKLRALELLGKKLKLFVERVEVENPQDEAYKLLLKQIREGEQK